MAVGAVLALAACGGTAGDQAGAAVGGKLAVVATTPEVADFVRAVGADDVAVTQIIKPNVDPHDYEPTPADLRAIGAAKVVVKNGVGLEKWLDQTIESAGFGGSVVDSSQGVALRKGDPGDEEMADGDPHIWHNPVNAKIMVSNIEKGLAAADPVHAATFAKNLAEYSARQLQNLVAKIKATGTRAIFTESSLPPKTAEAIAQQAGVEVVGGENALYGDSLGAPGTPQGSYLGAEQHNTETLVAALGG